MKKQQLIYTIISIVLCITTGCKTGSPTKTIDETFPEFYKIGHRGTRGHMPENTIPAMKKAIDDGANFLEVDVQISKDHQVIVTHDPHINRQITLMPNGNEIPKEDARKYLIYQTNYSEIRKFDVGSKFHKSFPEQQKMKIYIPLLGELIDSVETYTMENNLPPINYNIEIKANPKKDGEYQPRPKEYIKLVMDVLKNKPIDDRFYVQSFDVRQIQEVRKNHPEVVIGFLTSNREVTFEENIEEIGFFPNIYSPSYHLATQELIEKTQENNIKFIPWTVNSKEEMENLIEMGVDGIITDFPEILNEITLNK